MKTLQNNYTTPEQSKKLLELGVPADSADCYLTRFGIDEDWEVKVLNNIKYCELEISNQDYCLPCWSVGRIIEIMLNSQIDTGTYAPGFMLDKDTFSIESLIDIIDEDIKEFDFSKLEE